MQQFKCGKGHVFLFPTTAHTGLGAGDVNWIESKQCPECGSIHFTEYTEPIIPATVESVYIYDLTSGPQTELNGLLAQGYVIINRYAKTYSLEKPKVAESLPKEVTEAYQKLEGTKQ
jgi:hypothetical protein